MYMYSSNTGNHTDEYGNGIYKIPMAYIYGIYYNKVPVVRYLVPVRYQGYRGNRH